MLQIDDAHNAPGLAAVRDLFVAYAEAFDYHLCFDGFQDELAALPGAYAPPAGCLLLAAWDGAPAGCVALRRFEEGACELKRLYVRPAYRGRSIGRALAEAALARARTLGYRRIVLDTLPEMKRARALYTALGFRDAPFRTKASSTGSLLMTRDLTAP